MSLSGKRLAAEDSPDEDSGHDSADSLTTMPVDDKERIVHLETAVAWIKEEMDNLRKYDKEILQDLWKVRTGIHEIRESHRRQLEAESKYLTTSLNSQRRPSEAESLSPVSPTSPFSPFSTSHVASGHSVSKFKEPPHSAGVKKNDDAVLESFFGSESMTKLNSVLWKSSETEEKQQGFDSLYQKSQSTDRLDSAVLPALPEKKKRTIHPLSVSPKTSRVHASSPDVSSMRRGNQPVSDISSDMQQLRMRLRETANQTVAEIEEKFSPTLSRLTLGPAINLSSDRTPTGNHSHQGSLDSSTNNVPMLAQASTSARHGRQHSLPLSTVARTRPRSPTSSPPKSPSKHHAYSNSISPPSRSPTPPHNRQYSLGSGPSVSGLITTHYQNNPYEVPLSSRPPQPPHYPPSTGQQPSFNGTPSVPHRKAPPLPTTRQYSPSNQSGRTGGVHVSEQPGYVYGNRSSATRAGSQHHSNLDSTLGGRFYASNPNLLSAGSQEPTHYSTAVIKKRRKNTPTDSEAPRRLSNEYSTRKYESQHFDRQSSNGRYKQHPHPAGQVTTSQYDKLSYQPNSNNRNQRRTLSSSGESSQSSLEQIQPYMSTGDLRASMRQYQYVPYAEQKKSITSVGRGQPRPIYPEHTWL